RRLLSAATGGEGVVWDLATGAKVHTLPGLNAGGRRMAFLPGGDKILLVGTDQTLRLVDVKAGGEGRKIGPLPLGVAAVAVSEDGRLAVTAGGRLVNEGGNPVFLDCEVYLWDLAEGKPVGDPWKGHTSAVLDVAFSADGKRAVSCGRDGIRVWDVPGGK